MSDQQRPDPPPEEQQERRAQQPAPEPPPAPEPRPWPTLGADWREATQQPHTQTAPPPGHATWQPPPQQQWGQPPMYAPWHQPDAPRYPGARIPDAQARNWALAAHLSPLLSVWIGLPFLGPLLIWLAKRDDHPYVAEQAREALNFNLSVFIYAVALVIGSIALSIVLIGLLGFLLLPVLFVAWLVLGIVAAVKAANGEPYRYPFTIRLVN